MPYRSQGSLMEWVQQHYPDGLVPINVVAHIVKQATEALQEAHEQQIIHRDVKPSNFLVRGNPKQPTRPDLYLADFGIARIASATTNTSQAIRGTPTYMAPEQWESEAVPASDQYALAVMAYELLAGQAPFQGSMMRLMYQHLNTPPEPPSTFNPSLSSTLDEVLLKALAKRPEERFPSIADFAAAFQEEVQALEMANAPTKLSTPPLSGVAEPPGVLENSDLLADATTYLFWRGLRSRWCFGACNEALDATGFGGLRGRICACRPNQERNYRYHLRCARHRDAHREYPGHLGVSVQRHPRTDPGAVDCRKKYPRCPTVAEPTARRGPNLD